MDALLGKVLRRGPLVMMELMAVFPSILAMIVQTWALIGLWFIFNCFLHVLVFLYVHFVRRGQDLVKRFGKRVIVAGHIDELGWGIAQELSRRGHAVVVASVSDSGADCSSQRIAVERLSKASTAPIHVVYIDASWPECSPDRLSTHGRELLLDGDAGNSTTGMLVLLPPSPAATAPRAFSSHAADSGLDLHTDALASACVPAWLVRVAQPRAVIAVTSSAADIFTPQSALAGALSAFTARLTANLGADGSGRYAQRLVLLRALSRGAAPAAKPAAPSAPATAAQDAGAANAADAKIPVGGARPLLGGVTPERMARLCCDAMGRERVLAPHPAHAVAAWALRDLKMGPWLAWAIAKWELPATLPLNPMPPPTPPPPPPRSPLHRGRLRKEE